MSERGPQLEQTTQTDLLYGLSEQRASGTTTHSASATLDPGATLSHGFNEITPEEFNGPWDIVTQHAATRDDGTLLRDHDDSHTTDSGIRKASRWRYADGIAPRPYHTEHPPTQAFSERPHRPVSWRQWLAHCWVISAGWLTSFCVHVIALPVLLVLTVPAVIQHWGPDVEGRQLVEREMLEVSAPTEIAAPSIPMEFSTPLPVAMEVSLPDPKQDPGAAAGWLTNPAALLTTTSTDNPVDDVHGLFGQQNSGKSTADEGHGSAQFFGASAQGNKFVFVVDCSTSMQEHERWTHACQELEDSIGRLTPDQLFYIVLFDGTVHRMFNHEERDAALFPATAENKTRVAAWLRTVRLGPETRPFLAMKCALTLQPDAIFLLSDGDFSDPTAEFLKQVNRPLDERRRPKPQVTVHTINFHNRSLASQAMLKRIARENAGRYTFIAPK